MTEREALQQAYENKCRTAGAYMELLLEHAQGRSVASPEMLHDFAGNAKGAHDYFMKLAGAYPNPPPTRTPGFQREVKP